MKKANTETTEGDEPKNPEFSEQKRIRERMEKQKGSKLTVDWAEEINPFSKREKEIKQIRHGKNSPRKEKTPSVGEMAETAVEKTNKHARGVFDSVVDFAAGRESELKNVRQKKVREINLER